MQTNIEDASTTDRVRNITAPYVNKRIDRLTEGYIAYYAEKDRDSIIRRIATLDYEWDIDRVLMLNFSLVGGTTFLTGIFKKRGWLYFFAAQMAFLGLHAFKGWCPPAALFRRLGFRTRQEIDFEKQALIELLKEKKGA